MRSALVAAVIALVLVGCPQRPANQRVDDRAPAALPSGSAAAALASDAAVASTALDAAVAVDAALPTATIVDAPMQWSTKREQLTLDYRRAHSDAAAQDLTIEPRVIVLHYTAGGSAKATRGYFDNVEIEASRKELRRGGSVNVSSHFLVDRDGTIYRLQPETQFARHCIGLNHIAIGVENVGDEKKYPLTEAQVAANVALVRHLAARFPITHLLGHHEVMQFREHPYFVELDTSYRNDKGDPGARFMTRVRDQLPDLKLAGLK